MAPPELGAGGADCIREAAQKLRQAQAGTLATHSQADVIAALGEFVQWWRRSSVIRREAEAMTRPFPYAMTRISLEALLDSLTPDALWSLVESEGARDAFGPPLIGHVIAGNTPLLSWTSVIRALLMRSASLVKLPSGNAAEWGRLFHRSLAEVSPILASSVQLFQWSGGMGELDGALCESVDMMLAYGSDQTITALRGLCPTGTRLIGYGHRISFGLVLDGADWDEAARGLATDILLYDQGGCLSPQTVFVEGNWEQAHGFAACLAQALASAVPEYPLPERAPYAAARVREARALARMDAGLSVWEDAGLRWTVIARPESVFAASPTHGIVSVHPLASWDALPNALGPVRGRLQGCSLAEPSDALPSQRPELGQMGISFICPPGRLQAPPLSWSQDGMPPLRSLCP